MFFFAHAPTSHSQNGEDAHHARTLAMQPNLKSPSCFFSIFTQNQNNNIQIPYSEVPIQHQVSFS